LRKPKFSSFINLDLADYMIAPALADQKLAFEDLEGYEKLMEYTNKELQPVVSNEPPEKAFKRHLSRTMTSNLTMMDAINRLYKRTQKNINVHMIKEKKKKKKSFF